VAFEDLRGFVKLLGKEGELARGGETGQTTRSTRASR
jgi:hypothetical protein